MAVIVTGSLFQSHNLHCGFDFLKWSCCPSCIGQAPEYCAWILRRIPENNHFYSNSMAGANVLNDYLIFRQNVEIKCGEYF